MNQARVKSFLFTSLLLLFSCSDKKSYFEDGFEGLSLADTQTLSLSVPPSITNTNVSHYSLSGGCTKEGEVIEVIIKGLTRKATCSQNTWSVSNFDLSSFTLEASVQVQVKSLDSGQSVISTITNTSFDDIDDDNTILGFAGGLHFGTSSPSGSLVLSANANYRELKEDWTPRWDQLLAYFKMNNNWDDSIGTHTTSPNGVSFISDQRLGTHAASFNGTSDHVSITNLTGLSNINQFTISGWFYQDTLNVQGGMFGQVLNSTNMIRARTWSDGRLYSYVYNSGQGAYAYCSFDYSLYIQAQKWFYYTLVFDGTLSGNAQRMKVFINGEQVPLSFSGTVPSQTANLNGVNFDIAENFNIAVAGNHWDGMIDDFAVWTTALTPVEAKDIYEKQKIKYAGIFESRVIDSLQTSTSWSQIEMKTPLPFMKELTGDTDADGLPNSEESSEYSEASGSLSDGLVGLWHFKNNWNDSSGNNNNGTAFFNASLTTLNNNFENQVAAFDGDSDYVNFGSNQSLDFNGEFTVSFWLYLDNFSSSDVVYYPIAKGNYSNAGWALGINARYTFCSSRQGALFFSSGNATITHCSSKEIKTNKWEHILMKHASGIITMFINGEAVGSSPPTAINFDSSLNLILGTRSDFFGDLPGKVDELSIWDRALSNNEIIQIYRRGANRIKYQVRTCPTTNCTNIPWAGPDGSSSTYFSELYNRKTSGVYASQGAVQTSSLELLFSDFLSLTQNRYFQYRVIMESDDENNLCSATTCKPSLESVKVVP